MKVNENQMAELLTGSQDTDDLLRAAYDLGLRRGKELDRESLRLNVKIDTTRRLLIALMATQNIDLQAAMNALRIPRTERKTFVKLWAEKSKIRKTT